MPDVLLFSMKTTTVTFTPLAGSGDKLDFSDEITELAIVPAKGNTTLVVSGKKYSDQSDYTVNFSLLQNLATTGFLRALWDNEGEKYTLEATFKDSADAIRTVVTFSPAQVGGQAGNLATSSVTLDCDGKPAWFTPGA